MGVVLAWLWFADKRGVQVRLLLMVFAALLTTQCASGGGRGFDAGASSRALVIIGVAETAANQDPEFSMMWRRLDGDGAFAPYDSARAFEARTNDGANARVHGVPGEFAAVEVEPGAYALDNVYAVVREQGLIYYAQGAVVGPERPAFTVEAGEAVYLGIWEVSIDGGDAVTRLWRLEQGDLRAARRALGGVDGPVHLRETETRAVACAPQRVSAMSQRLIC